MNTQRLVDLSQADVLKSAGITGPHRHLRLSGHVGLNALSIFSQFALSAPELGGPRGTVAVVVASLDELRPAIHQPHMAEVNAQFACYPMFSDAALHLGYDAASFGLFWKSDWYPGAMAKLYRGNVYPDAFHPDPRPYACTNHFSFRRLKWYHLATTWDLDACRVDLYADGVLVGTSDRLWHLQGKPMRRDPFSGLLHLGNPSLVFHRITISNECWPRETVEADYAHSPAEDSALRAELAAVHEATDAPAFDFQPTRLNSSKSDASWITRLEESLAGPDSLKHFYVQGKTDAPTPTDQGLLVRTASEPPTHVWTSDDAEKHVYLWTNQSFEGDLYVRLRFKPLSPGGLSLLMFNATGMQREDFMADYPRPISGTMKTVCWSGVRNYHWEYHRQMTDTRNDGQSHALIKNPVLRPLAYRNFRDGQALDQWHELELLQEGGRLRGAIDGRLVFDVLDDPASTGAPVYNSGRIAIRCMTRTQMLFRDLLVMNSLSDYSISRSE